MEQTQKKKPTTTNNACCGSYLKRRVTKVKSLLPANPKVQGGVAVIYLGAGDISVKGNETGSDYYASDHSRHFKVYAEDADSVLRHSSIILKP